MLETRTASAVVEKNQLVGIAVPYDEWAVIGGAVTFR